MSLARLGAAVLLAAALVPVPGRSEGGKGGDQEGTEKKLSNQSPDAAMKEVKSNAIDAMMKEKFLACKKSGDCKPYLLEKEKTKKNKENTSYFPSKLEVKPRPGKPNAEERSSAEPLDAQGALVGPEPAAPSGGAPPSVEQAEAGRREAGERRERTMSRATGTADIMRRSFFPTEEAAPGGPGSPEPRTSPAGADPRTAFNPAEPRTVPEMALAAKTGFAATFLDQGLKVGAGSRGQPAIQRRDGVPASEADLARLGAALRSDPAALLKRPDFFEVLPREKFRDLKHDFAARPELRSSAFKDIGMTARERDFQWSSSCSGLSGNCNPHVGKSSYLKGQDVPPEDLDAVWSAAQEQILDEDDEFGEYTEEDRRLAAAEDLAEEKFSGTRRGAPSLASLLARMGELARGAGESAGFISARAVPASGSGPDGGRSDFTSDGFVRTTQRGGSAAPGSAPSAPPAPEGGRAARSWSLVNVLAAVVAAVLILRGLRRNR